MTTGPTSPAIIELQKRYTPTSLLSEYNPSLQVKYCRDVERVFTGKAPTALTVSKAFGRNTIESWLSIQLNDLSEFAGCKEKLSQRQIDELAQMITESYPHFKLTEFMLFFQRFKLCEYGKFYGAVDPMVIMQALRTFSEQRAEFYAKKEQRERARKAIEEDRLAKKIRQRYSERIPNAFTKDAPMSFLQYRLMGYDSLTDEELVQEIIALRSGEKTIPEEAEDIVNLIGSAFNVG